MASRFMFRHFASVHLAVALLCGVALVVGLSVQARSNHTTGDGLESDLGATLASRSRVDCTESARTLTQAVTSATHQFRSQISIRVAGTVQVAQAAGLSLAAPHIRVEPGFQVARGGTLRAISEAVRCPSEEMPGLTDIIWHVDDDNTTSNQSGSAQFPYASIQAAIDVAGHGDTIKVARGVYGPINAQGKALNLQGGYPGATSAAYQTGQGGDFATPSLEPEATVIAGNQVDPAVIFTRFDERPHFNRIDRFTVRQGSKGIVCDRDQSWPHPDNLTISNNIIEDNGRADDSSGGAGILICGQRATIRNNLIWNNQGGRGPGLHGACGERLLVMRNHIEDNIAYDDHGGGVYLTGPVILSHNLIAGNRLAWGYGWGGGVLIFNPEGHAQLEHNVIRDNWAPSYGGGVFIDEGATATLSHDLIYRNRTSGGIGGGIAVDDGYDGASQVTLNHCTIAFNNADALPDPYSLGGNGVFVDNISSVTLTNSILWGNGGDDLYVRDGSTLSVIYSLTEEVWPDVGNLSADPLFADPDAGDFHLRSSAGRWNPVAATWVTDTTDSPAIDAADPLAPFALESQPNGGRANLGAYGNTVEASRSARSNLDKGM